MVRISYLPEFLKQAKHLTKKYPSFPEDLRVLINEITENPLVGADLGGGIRKVTFNYLLEDDNREITLMTVYDKSERETISDKEIIELRNAILGTE